VLVNYLLLIRPLNYKLLLPALEIVRTTLIALFVKFLHDLVD
jgi:hypothetical protein